METPKKKYDVFISHAVEDKIPIANELCALLEKRGLCIWYSGRELHVGDDIIKAIEAGIKQSRFGVVIISPNYLKAVWALREFHALLEKEKAGIKVLLPVLYDITPEELAVAHPPMANMYAISATIGIDNVAEKLVEEINRQRKPDVIATGIIQKLPAKKWFLSIVFTLLAILGFYGFKSLHTNKPDTAYIHQSIENHIADLEEKKQERLKEELNLKLTKKATQDKIVSLYTAFKNLNSYYRNDYVLNTGDKTVRFKKNVDALLDANMQELNPLNMYGFQSPDIYVKQEPGVSDVHYFFINTQPLEGKTGEIESLSENTFAVWVSYTNNIRFIGVSLTFTSQSENTKGMKRHAMEIIALPPRERYVFERTGDHWSFQISPE
ncbi:MAG TPA: toll/interleukin-1 receptor domain-containing protein [Ohtaekwangia sp.]|uniref:toll/interleukin-1 receptor domain-containing protein n=1 Tax=Ohtaekwangia sp. TaxID=2066019 RepID=UPI002F951838